MRLTALRHAAPPRRASGRRYGETKMRWTSVRRFSRKTAVIWCNLPGLGVATAGARSFLVHSASRCLPGLALGSLRAPRTARGRAQTSGSPARNREPVRRSWRSGSPSRRRGGCADGTSQSYWRRGIGVRDDFGIACSCSSQNTLDFRPACRPYGSGASIFRIGRSVWWPGCQSAGKPFSVNMRFCAGL